MAEMRYVLVYARKTTTTSSCQMSVTDIAMSGGSTGPNGPNTSNGSNGEGETGEAGCRCRCCLMYCGENILVDVSVNVNVNVNVDVNDINAANPVSLFRGAEALHLQYMLKSCTGLDVLKYILTAYSTFTRKPPFTSSSISSLRLICRLNFDEVFPKISAPSARLASKTLFNFDSSA